MALAGALDDWAAIRRGAKRRRRRGELSQAARVADPDPWRTDLRNALDEPDKAARRAALAGLGKERELRRPRPDQPATARDRFDRRR